MLDYPLELKEALEVALSDSVDQNLIDDQVHVLEVLKSYECWIPLARFFERIRETDSGQFEQLALFELEIMVLGIGDLDRSRAIARDLVERCHYTFSEVRNKILRPIKSKDSSQIEILILEGLVDVFDRASDAVACQEAVCSKLERHCFDDERLERSFSKLLNLDPLNTKALRYYKSRYTHLGEFHKVTEYLKKLCDIADHPIVKSRLALELASIYLYNLQNPQLAIATIDGVVGSHNYDTSVIRFEAFFCIGEWDECIRILDSLIQMVHNPYELAILWFKQAELFEEIGNLTASEKAYLKTLEYDPGFIDALEGLIDLALHESDWSKVMRWLLRLRTTLKSQELTSEIDKILSFIERGAMNVV